MRFSTTPPHHYCGIDLQARTMAVCLLHRHGESLVHRPLNASPKAWRKPMAPSRDALARAVACLFAWDWRADRCAQEGLPVGRGPALSMNAIHGGTTTTDTLEAPTMAVWRRGGRRPQADGSPAELRATRDVLRRRMSRMRQRAALPAPVPHTTRQDNRPELGNTLASNAHRPGGADRFPAPRGRKTVAVALPWSDDDAARLRACERAIVETAQHHAVQTFDRLRAIPGVGKRLALVLRDALHDLPRGPRVQAVVPSARRLQCPRASAGKRAGPGGQKLGHVPLHWAVSEAAGRCRRNHPRGPAPLATVARTHGNAKALSSLAHHLGRAVSGLRKRHEAVDRPTWLAT